MSYWEKRLGKENITGYTEPPKNRDELFKRLKDLHSLGWVQTRQQVNDGVIGHILEDYLGIAENNVSLPDAGRYELKAQRKQTSSLTTLLHIDPWPRKPITVVANYLGPVYGWPHETIPNEWSFRVTMYGHNYTNRGFRIKVDRINGKIVVDFDKKHVSQDRQDWLQEVLEKSGDEFAPVPYWTFEELRTRLESKVSNVVYVKGESRKNQGYEEFRYIEATVHEGIDFDRFIEGIEEGWVYVDFDARTGHNHGTKFRIRSGYLEELYANKFRLF